MTHILSPEQCAVQDDTLVLVLESTPPPVGVTVTYHPWPTRLADFELFTELTEAERDALRVDLISDGFSELTLIFECCGNEPQTHSYRVEIL